MLFGDLLTENLKNIAIISSIVRYADEALPPLFFLLLVYSRLAQGRFVMRTSIDIPLVFFLLIALTSSFAANVAPAIVFTQFLLYTKGFITFYILFNLPLSQEELRTYMRMFSFIGVIFLFFGVVDFFIPEQFRRFTGNIIFIEYRGPFPSVKSFFIHPAGFGWFMCFLALFAFAYAIVEYRPAYFYSGIAFSLGCFFSMRARSIVGLIVSFGIGLFFSSAKNRLSFILILIPIIIVLIVVLGPALVDMYENKINVYLLTEDPGQIARNALYIKSVEIARDYFPLGAGMGRYGSWMSRVNYSPIYEKYGMSKIWGISKAYPNFLNDTFWPMVLGESGFIGLGCYAVIMIVILTTQFRRITRAQAKTIKAFHLGTFMIVIQALIASIADPTFTAPPAALFILGTVGLSGAIARAESRNSPELKELAR